MFRLKKWIQGKLTFPIMAFAFSVAHVSFYKFFDGSLIGLIILSAISMLFAWILGAYYDKLKYMAEKDALTGAYNRRIVQRQFAYFQKLAQHKSKHIVIFFIDIDHFKSINDQHGHHAGDIILQHVTDVLHQTFGKEECIVRWGGDEFLVMLLCDDPSGIDMLQQYILKRLFNPAHYDVDVTVSVGHSIYPEDGSQLHDLITKAGRQMYQSKKRNH